MATQETFIVGNREFTCVRMNAFAANKLFLRLQKVLVPVFGALVSQNGSLGDMDVKEAAALLAEHLDEKLIDDVVLPMFAEARVYSVENKRQIKSGVDVDLCFTAETLFDFYELIFLVGKHQFGPFIKSLASRFGSLVGGKTTPQ
jgi:prepilin signal peptidase PulO-like enzyme (type II secretory pathway)